MSSTSPSDGEARRRRRTADLAMLAPGIVAPPVLYFFFANSGFVAIVVVGGAVTALWVLWARYAEWRLIGRYRKSPFDEDWLP